MISTLYRILFTWMFKSIDSDNQSFDATGIIEFNFSTGYSCDHAFVDLSLRIIFQKIAFGVPLFGQQLDHKSEQCFLHLFFALVGAIVFFIQTLDCVPASLIYRHILEKLLGKFGVPSNDWFDPRIFFSWQYDSKQLVVIILEQIVSFLRSILLYLSWLLFFEAKRSALST